MPPPRPHPNPVRGKTRFPSTVLQSVYRGLWIKLTEDGLTGDRQVSLLMLMFLCARGCHRKTWKPKDAITRGSGVWFIYHLNGRWWISGSAGKKQTNKPETQETWVWSVGQEDSSGEGYGKPLQYSCLENPMDRGAWRAMVYKVAKSQIRLSAQSQIWLSAQAGMQDWTKKKVLGLPPRAGEL